MYVDIFYTPTPIVYIYGVWLYDVLKFEIPVIL